MPEDIEQTPKQLDGSKPDNNPLLAGTNQIVQFWANYNAVQADSESQPVPYVLLVVRPSGTVGFYLARKFLAGLGADSGYELVEEDLEFSAPESDPRAREMALAAISEMLATRTQRGDAATFSETLEDDGDLDGAGNGRGGSRNGTAGGTGRNGTGAAGGGPGKGRGGTGNSSPPNALAAAAEAGRSFDSRLLRHGPSASDSFFESGRFRKHQSRAEGGISGGSSTGETRGSGFGPGRPRNGVRGGTGNRTQGFKTGSGPGDSAAASSGSGASNDPIGLRSTPQPGTIGKPGGSPVEPKPFQFSTGPDPLVAGPENSASNQNGGEAGTSRLESGLDDSSSAPSGRKGTAGSGRPAGNDLKAEPEIGEPSLSGTGQTPDGSASGTGPDDGRDSSTSKQNRGAGSTNTGRARQPAAG
ncbi:MAG: hypothetical protein H8E37_11880, partial [Planctomycetes bacterium]|nr:hypothetical protein [Planctomycetota bacterium]